jgi:hypothetical protein
MGLARNLSKFKPNSDGLVEANDIAEGAISVTPTTVSDQTNSSTGYFDLPAGTTAERPDSPATGMIRYNTTESQYEVYKSSGWVIMSTTGYPYSASYLIVAGGGG